MKKLKKSYSDTAVMSSSHCLILGSTNLLADADLEKEVNKAAILSAPGMGRFGLFEYSSPNLNTYYPNLSVDDIKVKDEDFVKPMFRLLSEVVVHAKHNPIDFSKPGILKASMERLVGQTVYANHDSFVGNQVGVIESVKWQNGYTTNDGVKVPAGINGVLKIDAKSHPTLARGILMDPPSVHSNSVTVSFDWEPSHQFELEEDFYRNLGKIGADGQLVRRVVTAVKAYHETSLVAHGADGFAQRIGSDGKILNPKYGETQHSLSNGDQRSQYYYNINFKDCESLSLGITGTPNTETQTQTFKMKDQLIALAALLGIQLDTNSTEEAQLTLVKQTATAKMAEVNTLKTDLAEAKSKAITDEQLTFVNLGKDFLKNKREAVTTLYNKVKGDKAEPSLLAAIQNGDLAFLDAMDKEYQVQLEAQFPLACTECNSLSVSRKTAAVQTPGTPESPKGKVLENLDASLDRFKQSKKPGSLFSAKKA